MDNAVLKNLIEQRVKQNIEHATLPGLNIEAFSWDDYTFSIHYSKKGCDVEVFLFKDAEELGYLALPLTVKTDRRALFELLIVPNVPEFFDDVESNDNADNGYIGNNVWAVKVVEEAPFEQFDTITSSAYIGDTLHEMDNQDLGDYIGLDQFDLAISELEDDEELIWANIDLAISLEQSGLLE